MQKDNKLIKRVIRHKKCGGLAMYYIGDPNETIQRAQDVMFLDGTQPNEHTPIAFNCPVCHEKITHPKALIRCMEEIVE
jgi:hypothetical protein